MTETEEHYTAEDAAGFLEDDLRASADRRRDNAKDHRDSPYPRDQDLAEVLEAAADRLDELADAVELIDPTVLAAYAAARRRDLTADDWPDGILGEMTLAVGLLLDLRTLRTIEDFCLTYIRAVEWVHADPRWADPSADMWDFWREFVRTGNA